MKAKEFIEDFITYSDLSGSGLVSKYQDSDPNLQSIGAKGLLSFINLGIMALHRKFVLHTEILEYDCVPDVPFLELREKNLGILLETLTPGGDTLEFPSVDEVSWDINEISKGKFLVNNPSVQKVIFIYTGTPARLTDIEDELDIPDLMLEALLHYVCYKGFATTQSTANQTPISQNDFYFKRFNHECNVLKAEGFDTISDVKSRNVRVRGWV